MVDLNAIKFNSNKNACRLKYFKLNANKTPR